MVIDGDVSNRKETLYGIENSPYCQHGGDRHPNTMGLFCGALKVAAPPQIVETLSRYGAADYVLYLGIMELLFAGRLAYRRTMKFGFILPSCYFSGAISAELAHQALTAKPFNPLVIIWIGAFINDRTIFLPKSESAQHVAREDK